MSRENVEKVRAGFAAHNRGDLDAWLDLYDPDVEFETLLLGAHQGKEAMRSLYEENQANQSGYTVTPVELIRRWRQGDHGGPSRWSRGRQPDRPG